VWITTNIPKIIHKPKVWKAFLKYSELMPDDAKKSLKKGSNPILGYKVMPRSNGMFSASKFPNKIFLAKSICDKFEKSKKEAGNKKMHILLESTILHEMTHWGDWRDKKHQKIEEGKAFEKAAYGKDVNRYW